MITDRKVRGDAKLEWLKGEQKKQLLVWLDEENRTYGEVVKLVKTEFGVTVGKSAVGSFWRRHVLPRRYQEEAEGAEGIEGLELPEGQEGKFEQATLKLARMQAWAAMSQPEPEIRKAERLLGLVWRAERMALARDKLALAQQRVVLREQAAAARAAAGGKRGMKGGAGNSEGGEQGSEGGGAKPWMTEEQLREYLKIDFSQWDPPMPIGYPPLFPGSVGVGCDKPAESLIEAGKGQETEGGNHEIHEIHENRTEGRDEGEVGGEEEAVRDEEEVVVKDRGFLF